MSFFRCAFGANAVDLRCVGQLVSDAAQCTQHRFGEFVRDVSTDSRPTTRRVVVKPNKHEGFDERTEWFAGDEINLPMGNNV